MTSNHNNNNSVNVNEGVITINPTTKKRQDIINYLRSIYKTLQKLKSVPLRQHNGNNSINNELNDELEIDMLKMIEKIRTELDKLEKKLTLGNLSIKPFNVNRNGTGSTRASSNIQNGGKKQKFKKK